MPIAFLRFVVFQIIWWLLVLSPKFGSVLGLPVSNFLSLTIALLAAIWILRGNFQNRAHWYVVLAAVSGYFIDSFLVTTGYLVPWPVSRQTEIAGFTLAPFWLLGLWLAFAAVSFSTVTSDFAKYFRSNKSAVMTLTILAVAGAVGGPVSYAVGKPLEVLSIGNPRGESGEITFGLGLLALEWLVMFPLIVVLSWKAKKNGR